MKFLSQINVNTEYTLPIVDGTNGQVLTTDGSGAVYWGSVSIGALNLDGLQDVVITTPSSGQLLRYGIPVGSEDPNPVWHNWTPNFVTTANAVTITGTQTITGSKTFTAATTMSIASGSDVALTITKGGNHEALYINKTSGSGNAVTIVGTLQATTIVKTGGTASQFLKADGSVDTNTYLTAHPAIANGGSVNNSLGTVVQDITVDANGHVTAIGSVNLDTRYYTQDDIAALFGGDTAIAGYNLINWDTAFGWGNHASAGYATTSYVNTAIANLVDTAPDALNTLNELAAALGDDPNFATTVTNSIATKLPLAGGTMTGQILTPSVNTGVYDGAVQIREYAYVNNTQTAWGYSPAITFHWGNITVKRFGMRSDGQFAIDDAPLALQSWVTSQGYLTTYQNNYISDVRLSESILEFTGEGSAFNGSIDLSTLPFQPVGSYLTAEADTLATVTGRGASTNTTLSLGGGFNVPDNITNYISRFQTNDYTTMFFFSRAWQDVQGANGLAYNFTTHTNSGSGGYGALQIYYGESGYVYAPTSFRSPSVYVNSAYINQKLAISSGDTWLRLNQSGEFTSGVYTPYLLRNDGQFINYGGVVGYNTIKSQKAQTDNNYTTAALWTESFDNTTTGIAFHISGNVGKFLEMRTNGVLYWENAQVWTAGTLTNLNQLTNGPGYITGYTETDTLQSVTSRGSSTNTDMSIGGAGADRGLRINHDDYGRIRFYQGASNLSTIHSFSTSWSGGDVLASGGALNLTGNTGVTIGGWNIPDVVFRNGGSTYFRNSVGFGTTTPQVALDVNGHVGVVGSNHIYFGHNTTNIGAWTTRMYASGSTHKFNAQTFVFNNEGYGSSEFMRVNGTGVGIGTIDPNYKLDVNGEGQIGYINFEYNANYAGVRWKDSAYNLRWKLGNDGPSGHWLYLYDYAKSSSAFTFKPNSDMLFTPGGNVGVGTDLPSTKLHVGGVITATGGNSTNWNTAYGWGNHATASYIKADSTEPLTIQAGEVIFTGSVTVEGTFTESSSIRFKENITPLDPALDKVNQLEAVSYNKIGVDDREIGLIAEEVAELFPEVVTYNEEGAPTGVQYQRLSVILLKAVQELTERVNKLENK